MKSLYEFNEQMENEKYFTEDEYSSWDPRAYMPSASDIKNNAWRMISPDNLSASEIAKNMKDNLYRGYAGGKQLFSGKSVPKGMADLADKMVTASGQAVSDLTPSEVQTVAKEVQPVAKPLWEKLVKSVVAIQSVVNAWTPQIVKDLAMKVAEELIIDTGAELVGKMIANATKDWSDEDKKYWIDIVDKWQERLNIIGMTPVLGDALDLLNSYIYAMRAGATGDPYFQSQALQSLASAAPIGGAVVGTAKATKTGLKMTGDTLQAVKKGEKITDALKAANANRMAKAAEKLTKDAVPMKDLSKLDKTKRKIGQAGDTASVMGGQLAGTAAIGGMTGEPWWGKDMGQGMIGEPPPDQNGTYPEYANKKYWQQILNQEKWRTQYNPEFAPKIERAKAWLDFSTKWPVSPPEDSPNYYTYLYDIWSRKAKYEPGDKSHYEELARQAKKYETEMMS